jgi:hypothetical protein
MSTDQYGESMSLKLNFVAGVRERTLEIELPPLAGEVSAKFLRIKGAT